LTGYAFGSIITWIEKEAFFSMPLLLDLFLTFAKIGAFTFGGGYAMLSVISDNCVEKKKWITADDMMNITVIAETTPGPISVNCATFTGYRQKGVLGAIAATAGLVLPSFIVIFLISLFLDKFLEFGHRHFPNFLSKNGYGNTCDEMLCLSI
jgi:chromate transport protein ChrA